VAISERRKAATRSLVSREFSMILLFGAVFVSGVVGPGQVMEVEEGGRMWKARKKGRCGMSSEGLCSLSLMQRPV